MANPQKENGYVPIANIIMDVLVLADFTAGEYKFLLLLLRKTWGWNKKEDWIALSQLETQTGFSHKYVSTLKQKLLSKKVITQKDNKLSFNKNYDDWVVNYSTPPPVYSSSSASVLQFHLPVYCSTHTKDIITKDTNTKDKQNFPSHFYREDGSLKTIDEIYNPKK